MLLFYFMLFSFGQLWSQYDHIDIFPQFEGQELFDKVIEEFKAENLQSYREARQTMYAIVDNRNDTVECVYTGMKRYLEPNVDAVEFLYLDGSGISINAEHTFPQSKGAGSGSAKTDIHHLFPSRSVVNSARGSDPFGEIPDNQTASWYINDDKQSAIPNNNIDGYTEDTGFLFEPREEHKGNVARAMFYFYTMYRSSADSDYFEEQKDVMCQWHFEDPVDQEEWERTYLIAEAQETKPNPFVLDCSLASRFYCSTDPVCETLTDVEILGAEQLSQCEIFPNPSTGRFEMDFNLISNSKITIGVYNVDGKIVNYNKINLSKGKVKVPFKNYLSKGIFIVKLEIENNLEKTSIKRKVIIH